MSDSPSVFLSYSSKDREIADIVFRSLERNDLRCWVAHKNIGEGDLWQKEIVRGIDSSRVVICLLSATSNQSEQVHREIHLAFSKKKIVIPIRIEDVELSEGLEYLLGNMHRLDAISTPFESHLGIIIDSVKTAVIKAVKHQASGAESVQPEVVQPPEEDVNNSATGVLKAQKPQKIALLYKRSATPDDEVLANLEAGLRDAGHSVFVDRHMNIGVEWVGEIERQVREADAVIPLLSASSVGSEMLSWEIKTASNAAQQQFGKPRILPVRIVTKDDLNDVLPEPFQGIVSRFQYALWRTPEDNKSLLVSLLDGLDAKDPPKIHKDAAPGGAVPLDSRYYIPQPSDEEFHDGLMRQDGILLVKGARQMGKTSLLARGLQKAREANKTVASLDLQNLNQDDLKDLPSLYKALGGMIAQKLKLDVYPQDKWRDSRGANANFENYIVDQVMGRGDSHVVIALDEVDRLFSFGYSSEVFGLFRSWFNARTVDPSMPWGRLTLAIVYATEPHLFITDQHQSPFNVGTKIDMKDFDIGQVGRLNELYERPIQLQEDLEKFHKLFRGQPYLTRRGFYELTQRHMSLDQLFSQVDMDEGPFGDHLRRILIMVARDKRTLDVITRFSHGEPLPDQMTFYNLRSGGLISGHSPENATFRCAIYESYLKRHLG